MSTRLSRERQLHGHKDRVYHMGWSPQATRLASVGQTGGFVWSIDGGERVALGGNEVMRVCWHLDGLHVVTGDSKGRISVYTASDGAATATLEASASREEPDEVYGLQMLSIDGLLAAGTGNEVQLWDLAHSTCVARTEFARSEKGCVFGGADRNPEGRAYLFDLVARGRALCAALSDGTIRLLDAQTLQPVGTLTEHSKRGAPVFGVAISPRSPLLATSDGDGTVLVWDLRQAQRGPLAETSRDTAVHALSFVAGVGLSGEMLATGADTTL